MAYEADGNMGEVGVHVEDTTKIALVIEDEQEHSLAVIAQALAGRSYRDPVA